MSIFTAAKLHTVGQKNVTMWGYVADPLVFVVNKEVWASWTEADRAIVRQAAIDAGKQQIEIARKGLAEADRPLLKEIAALGVTIKTDDPKRTDSRARADGGAQRWIYCEGRPAYTAGNRYGMPERIPYIRGEGFKALAQYFPQPKEG